MECVEFPPHRNCLWTMWGRDACKVYERKMADTERQTKVRAELWNVSLLLRREDEETSSNRATKAFTFASPCSCFLFTPSSPRNLLFLHIPQSLPAPSGPNIGVSGGPCLCGCMDSQVCAVWVYGFMIETHSGVAEIQWFCLCSFGHGLFLVGFCSHPIIMSGRVSAKLI